MPEKKQTPRQLFTAQRKELLAKLAGANIKHTVSGTRGLDDHTDGEESFVATFENGKIITATCVKSPIVSEKYYGNYIYTVDLAGEVLVTDTSTVSAHGYGSEAKLIWLDIKRTYKSKLALNAVMSMNNLTKG